MREQGAKKNRESYKRRQSDEQKDTNSSAQQKLKEETTQLLSVVEETEKELEKSYRTLAEEPKENGENAHLDQKIQKEIDSLKEVNNDLKQAHQRTMAMEDELSGICRRAATASGTA